MVVDYGAYELRMVEGFIMLGGMLWNLPARSWEILAVQTTKELKPIVYIVDDQWMQRVVQQSL